MKNVSKIQIIQILSVILGIAMLVLSCFLLADVRSVVRVVCILFFLALTVTIPSLGEKYKSAIKILFVLLCISSVALISYLILSVTGILAKIRSFEHLKNLILRSKHWGIIVFLLLTILQVVVLPIPAAVTILIGVAIYGPFWSFVLSTIGTYIGSLISFWLGKTFGKRLVIWMIGETATEKYSNLIYRKGKFMFALMLLFPFFPDDILCMVAGITNMTYRFFIITVALTRPVMIAFMSFFGSGKIIPFKGWGIPVWIGLFALCIVLFFVFGKIKNKIMENRSNRYGFSAAGTAEAGEDKTAKTDKKNEEEK